MFTRHPNLLSVLLLLGLAGILGTACRRQPPPLPTVEATTAAPLPATPATAPPPSPTPAAGATATRAAPSLISLSALPRPRLIARHPAAGAEVGLDGPIELIFDQPMDPAKTSAAWRLVDAQGQEVTGQVSFPQPRILRFQPAQRLKPNSTYQAILAQSAASASGESLLEGLALTFNSRGNLELLQTTPADQASGVAIDSAITVIFNRPVVPLRLAEEQAALPNPLQIKPEVAGQGQWLNTSVYLFRPETAWRGSQTYQVRVDAGIVNALSSSDAQMPADYAWSFTTTAPTFNQLELIGLGVTPRPNFPNLSPGQGFRLTFNQPMDTASTEAALSLRPAGGGPPVPLVFRWDDTTLPTTLAFTPTHPLALATAYVLQLDTSAQAAGGGQLGQGFTWQATTQPYPAILSTTPADGAVADSSGDDFRLQFASPMELKSLAGKVLFDPPISGNPDGDYYPWDLTLHFFGFRPSTRYTVQILPGMRDLFGNEIGSGRSLSFTTPPAEPLATFFFPGELALFRQGGTSQVLVNYRNVSRLDVALYRLEGPAFLQLLDGRLDRVRYLPAAEQLLWQRSREVIPTQDEIGLEPFDLAPDGGTPPAGLYFITLDSPETIRSYSYGQSGVLAVANANLVLKTTATEAMIWLTELESSLPLPGVPVALYDRDMGLVFRATTDENGLAYRDGLDLGTDYQDSYLALTEDPAIFGLAISTWNAGVYPYSFGIFSDFSSRPGEPTAYVYADRPLYRPGQPVYFKGIVRLNDDLRYSLPAFPTVQVTIDSFDETISSQELPLSPYGTFAGQITLDGEAALGSYSISVEAGGKRIGYGRFDVAEYRKPTFRVQVTTPAGDVLAGERIPVTVEAQFFAGGSVVNGSVQWGVQATSFSFAPGGDLARYDFTSAEQDLGYDFGDFYRLPLYELVAQGSGATDGQGRFTVDIPAEPADAPGPQSFTIEATVTDGAGNAVSGRTQVVVHRGRVYAGIRPQGRVAQAGQPLGFDLVLVDWGGNPVPNHPFSLEIVERRWHSVQEQDSRGNIAWRSQVEEVPVASFSSLRSDAEGKATATFTPETGGVYRAYATVGDESGGENRSSSFVWVAGDDFIAWRRSNDHNFDLIADAGSYRPGDSAELLIASPFQGQTTALVTVERGHIKQHEVLRLSGNSTLYRLPITADMAPNVIVSVMLLKGVDESNPIPDFKVGMVQLEVEREQQALQVEISPDREVAGPGDTVQFTVRVTDYRGQPVPAELSLSLTDLAVLSLRPRLEQPILDFFYAQRWLSVNTALLLDRLMDRFNQELPEAAFTGGGGGKGESDEFGVQRVRQNFPDTAYWAGQVQTGDDGTATVAITLPDNTTTWRMDARAVTGDTLVGQATRDIVATLPLMVQPQTARFYLAGDSTQLGALLLNNSDAPIEASVTLEAEGVTLLDAGNQQLTVPAHSQAFVAWDGLVQDVDRVDLLFSAAGGGFFDASRPPLGSLDGQGIPVYRYQVPEEVGTSGQLSQEGAVVESIALPLIPGLDSSAGQVRVTLATSLAAAMSSGLDYLAHYPYECTEQIISRFLPNVATTRALKTAGVSDPALEAALGEQVNVALQRLYSRQRVDGGWPWWDSGESNSQITAYVVLGLLEARDSGYQVSEGVLRQGLRFLQQNLQSVDRLSGRARLNRQAFLLYVLSRAGEAEPALLEALYQDRSSLDQFGRGFLALAIFLMDNQDPRLATLAGDFVGSAILSATGTHWEEEQPDYWNWNSNTRTTAIVLAAMVRLEPGNPLVANGVRWLMAHRTDGHWLTTQETAWTLLALTDWMVASGELGASFRYEVALNGALIASGQASAANLRQTTELVLPTGDLAPQEVNRLAFGRSEGPGTLYYSTHLRLALPVAQVGPLDQGIALSRRYFRPEERETPVTEATQGETLVARLTIVAPHDLHFVVVEDALPAGLEAVDQSLLTSQQATAPPLVDWSQAETQGWGWWYFDHVELRDEKVVLSADFLPAGTYDYVYLVRATTPGTYQVIPPTAQQFYFPEVSGRGAGSLFVVKGR